MDAHTKARKINHDQVLDEVLERLSKELHLTPIQTSEGMELQGGIYIVRRENPRLSFPWRLSYTDKTATFQFNESNPPTIDYELSIPYLGGQLDLLRRTETKIGKQLLPQLESVKSDRERQLDKCDRRILAQLELDANAPLRIVSFYQKLQIPDFKEAYPFIKGHILFR